MSSTPNSPPLALSDPRPGMVERSALRFVLAIGMTSAFSDMTHEGARSITGPFLSLLGASGAVVSTVSGEGELLGYALRYVSGFAADRTQRYWTVTFIGYILQMSVVPFLAIAPTWHVAALFIVGERVGRAIRTPARDAMTAHAASRLGSGWAFGVREALDAGGAVVGPLLVTGITVYTGGEYRIAFAILSIPATLCIGSLFFTWSTFPDPANLDEADVKPRPARLGKTYWIYLGGMCLTAVGYADWPLIALHFQARHIVRPELVPSLYVAGMGAEAAASLALGRLYDRYGVSSVVSVTLLTSTYGLLVFLGNSIVTTTAGTVIWGIGMAAQESVVKAVLTSIVASDHRARAYGLFDTLFGVSWFVGSVILGVLYDHSPPQAAWFSLIVQLCAVPVLASMVWLKASEGVGERRLLLPQSSD